MSARPARRDAKEHIRAIQHQWLGRVMEATGKSPSRLALDAGVSDTTLTRFYNDPRYQGTLAPMTVQAISELTGIAGPGAMPGGNSGGGHQLDEAHPVRTSEIGEELQTAIANLIAGRLDAHPWRMKSDVLALAGVRIGDILIVEQREKPRDGDVVCAQIEVGYGARTVFRLLQTPNLVGAAFDPKAVRPELIDGARVRVAGVMTDLIRRRA